MTNPLDLGDVFGIEYYIDVVEAVLKEKQINGSPHTKLYPYYWRMSGSIFGQLRNFFNEMENQCSHTFFD
jgi:hypothetical protein